MKMVLRLKQVAIERCRERVIAARQSRPEGTKNEGEGKGNPVVSRRLKEMYGL
ncbi:MAG: hypothetical protein QHG99_01140 [Methanomicrobiales archaeon]|nr:hypothetical protein [Methanomicrobiales archaeon]